MKDRETLYAELKERIDATNDIDANSHAMVRAADMLEEYLWDNGHDFLAALAPAPVSDARIAEIRDTIRSAAKALRRNAHDALSESLEEETEWLLDLLAASVEREAKLRAALDTYGQHRNECAAAAGDCGDCSCGYDAALGGTG